MLQRLALVLSTAALAVTVACSQSDPGITTAVKAKLAADDVVKAHQIDVDTTDGVVTLRGRVETAAQKEQAVVLARQADGVRDVMDQLTITPAATATTGQLGSQTSDIRQDANGAAREAREEGRETAQAAREAGRDAKQKAGDAADRSGAAIGDAAITAAVKSKFLADTAVSGLKVNVDTNGGVVTLSGAVSTQAEADRAASLARQTDGVTRVVNNLRVGN
jgi:hyperosmotically inducible periplasmic protein